MGGDGDEEPLVLRRCDAKMPERCVSLHVKENNPRVCIRDPAGDQLGSCYTPSALCGNASDFPTAAGHHNIECRRQWRFYTERPCFAKRLRSRCPVSRGEEESPCCPDGTVVHRMARPCCQRGVDHRSPFDVPTLARHGLCLYSSVCPLTRSDWLPTELWFGEFRALLFAQGIGALILGYLERHEAVQLMYPLMSRECTHHGKRGLLGASVTDDGSGAPRIHFAYREQRVVLLVGEMENLVESKRTAHEMCVVVTQEVKLQLVASLRTEIESSLGCMTYPEPTYYGHARFSEEARILQLDRSDSAVLAFLSHWAMIRALCGTRQERAAWLAEYVGRHERLSRLIPHRVSRVGRDCLFGYMSDAIEPIFIADVWAVPRPGNALELRQYIKNNNTFPFRVEGAAAIQRTFGVPFPHAPGQSEYCTWCYNKTTTHNELNAWIDAHRLTSGDTFDYGGIDRNVGTSRASSYFRRKPFSQAVRDAEMEERDRRVLHAFDEREEEATIPGTPPPEFTDDRFENTEANLDDSVWETETDDERDAYGSNSGEASDPIVLE